MTRYTRDLPHITAEAAETERDRLFRMPEADLPADLGKQPETRVRTTMTDHVPSTQVEINGFTWTIYADATPETIEQVIKVSKALAKRGYKAPARGSWGGKPAAKPLTQPRWNDAGDPCCTVHVRRNGEPTPLNWVAPKDGRPGFWGCPAKSDGTPGETINQNGYCSLRFDAPAPETVERSNGR